MHSLRSATAPFAIVWIRGRFQSMHSLRSATSSLGVVYGEDLVFQSMHSLRSATRCTTRPLGYKVCYFNPCTPYGVQPHIPPNIGSLGKFQSMHSLRSATPGSLILYGWISIFQSMHSLRSATSIDTPKKSASLHFNPCTPYGVQLAKTALNNYNLEISIHALLTECNGFAGYSSLADFVISIHALLTECNAYFFAKTRLDYHFNPCTPYGVQHRPYPATIFKHAISIHALLTECNQSRLIKGPTM